MQRKLNWQYNIVLELATRDTLAYVSRMNAMSKSGSPRVGTALIAYLSLQKASSALESHWNPSFFNSSEKG